MDRPLSPRLGIHTGSVDGILGRPNEEVRDAVQAIIAHGIAAEENAPCGTGIGRVFQIHGTEPYRALGTEDICRHCEPLGDPAFNVLTMPAFGNLIRF